MSGNSKKKFRSSLAQAMPEVHFSSRNKEKANVVSHDKKKSPLHYLNVILRIIIFLILILLAYLIGRTWMPQNMDRVEGFNSPYEVSDKISDKPQDILRLLQRATEANYPLVLSEKEVNKYLAAYVRGRQDGPFSLISRYDGVGIKFHDGYAEIILVRTLFHTSFRQTVSMFIKVKNAETMQGPSILLDIEGPTLCGSLPIGGRMGKLPVPQGYMLFAKSAFESLAQTLHDELDLLQDPNRVIEFKEGSMHIYPAQ